MRRYLVLVFIFHALIITIGCREKNGPAKLDRGPRADFLSPLIFDGHISVLTPVTETYPHEFFGMMWGDTVKHPYFVEQSVICNVPSDLAGSHASIFPTTLPMAKTAEGTVPVLWKFAMNPNGTPAPDELTYQQFLNYAKFVTSDHAGNFYYGLTIGVPHVGGLPKPGTENLRPDAWGLMETFEIDLDSGKKCLGSIFALDFEGTPSSTDKSLLPGAIDARRILEALNENCSGLTYDLLKDKQAAITVVSKVKYEEWYATIKWGDMSYSDGRFVYAQGLPPSLAAANAIKDDALKKVSR
jgi:hypothetical protein